MAIDIFAITGDLDVGTGFGITTHPVSFHICVFMKSKSVGGYAALYLQETSSKYFHAGFDSSGSGVIRYRSGGSAEVSATTSNTYTNNTWVLLS